jgi:CRISPR-associated protein Cas1
VRQILNTLFVMTQGSYVRLERDTIVVELEGGERLKTPLHHLGAVVLYGNIMVTPFLLHRCAEDGRAVVLMSASGRFCARLEGPQSGNVLLRRAQHRRADDAIATAETARLIVAGKIQNCRMLALRARRDAEEEAARDALQRVADDFAAALRALPAAGDTDTIRGIEGNAARLWFAAFPLLLRGGGAFAFSGRTRRPPLDRTNALLSFLYALLLNDCRSAIEATGLDPQIGFLHGLRPGRAGLALDLMEEFRPLLADRLAFALVNRGQITAEDFTLHPGGAVSLGDAGRRTVVAAYQRRKQEEVMHPVVAETLPLGLVPLVQARLLARHLRGEASSYEPFVPR